MMIKAFCPHGCVPVYGTLVGTEPVDLPDNHYVRTLIRDGSLEIYQTPAAESTSNPKKGNIE